MLYLEDPIAGVRLSKRQVFPQVAQTGQANFLGIFNPFQPIRQPVAILREVCSSALHVSPSGVFA